MEELSIKKNVKLKAKPEAIFDFLTTPGKVKLVLPSLLETNNTPNRKLQEGDCFDTVYRMYGVLLNSKWHVKKLKPPSYYEAYSDGDAKSTWVYDILPSNGETDLSVKVSYQIPNTLLGKVERILLTALNEREIENYLRNLETLFAIQG